MVACTVLLGVLWLSQYVSVLGFGLGFSSNDIASQLPGWTDSSGETSGESGTNSDTNTDISIGTPQNGEVETQTNEAVPTLTGSDDRMVTAATLSRRRKAIKQRMKKLKRLLAVLENYFRNKGVLPQKEEEEEVSEFGVKTVLNLASKSFDIEIEKLENQTLVLKQAIDDYQSPTLPEGTDGGAGGTHGEGGNSGQTGNEYTDGEETRFSDRKWLGFFDTSKVEDVSGMAQSRIHDDILYLITDDGSTYLYVMNSTTGEYLNRIEVRGSDNNDWEDVATGPCAKYSDESCVYISDTGRTEKYIYLLPEPSDPIDDYKVYVDDKYPVDDVENSIEAIMVSPQADIYLLTETEPSNLIKVSKDKSTGTDDIRRNCAYFHDPDGGPTAADMSVDGTMVLIKTEKEIFFYYVTDGNYEDVICDASKQIQLEYSAEDDGQSLCFRPDGLSYLTCNESLYSALWTYDRLKVNQVTNTK